MPRWTHHAERDQSAETARVSARDLVTESAPTVHRSEPSLRPGACREARAGEREESIER